MKAIKNTHDLSALLFAEDENWQQIVYDQTGVIVILNNSGGTLFSKCGYIDLDSDAEYTYKNRIDCTEYCEIKSIQELIAYINEMDSYKAFLVDVSYGKFKKSELFWAICSQIICPKENQMQADGTIYQDWGLQSIGFYDGHVEVFIALIACDMGVFWLDIDENTTLSSALNQLINQMRSDTPQYNVYDKYSFSVPQTYSDLLAQLSDDGLYSWLV